MGIESHLVPEKGLSLIQEALALRQMIPNRGFDLKDEHSINERWDLVDKIRLHLESFLLRAAASNTVIGFVFAGIFTFVNQKDPALFIASLALALDVVAGLAGHQVEEDAEKIKRNLKLRHSALSPKTDV